MKSGAGVSFRQRPRQSTDPKWFGLDANIPSTFSLDSNVDLRVANLYAVEHNNRSRRGMH